MNDWIKNLYVKESIMNKQNEKINSKVSAPSPVFPTWPQPQGLREEKPTVYQTNYEVAFQDEDAPFPKYEPHSSINQIVAELADKKEVVYQTPPEKEFDYIDLEEKIYACWNIIDDLKVLSRSWKKMNSEEKKSYIDALISVYNVKFDEMFDVFNKVI